MKLTFIKVLFFSALSNLLFAQPIFLGMTERGGDGFGTIFKTDTSGNAYQVLTSFAPNTPGATPTNLQLLKANNGKLYGMTSYGGAFDAGIIFEYDPTNNSYTKKIDLNISTGAFPSGSLMQAQNGKLYGMTSFGGDFYGGTLFEYDYGNNTITKLKDFDYADGYYPRGALVQASNSKLYGLTQYGGAYGNGVLFEYELSTGNYHIRFDFDQLDGENPNGSLFAASNGKLYGLTQYGGTNGVGVLFDYDISTFSISKLHDFSDATGAYPTGSFIEPTTNKLYALTNGGGLNSYGVIYEFDISTGLYSNKHDFDEVNGAYPEGSLFKASNGKLYAMTTGGGVNWSGVLFEYDYSNNTFAKKYDFSMDGYGATGALIEAANGKLFGTTDGGGMASRGVVFEYDINSNAYSKKLDFSLSINGANPSVALFLASNGKYYGMTTSGGNNNAGTIFEYNYATNIYTKRFDFSTNLGMYPMSSFVEVNNKLYGLTQEGGSADNGVLFEFDLTSFAYTVKHTFNGTNGLYPSTTLLKAANGKLYGTTSSGGQNYDGVLFEFDPSTGTFSKKYDFVYTEGSTPVGRLIQASNGKLYGLTSDGGANYQGTLFEFDLSTNTYTKKIDFQYADGAYPYGSLIEASNGNLYGLASGGGDNGDGVLFEYNVLTNGFLVKYHFNQNGGRLPEGSLMLASNGKFYGMTSYGGLDDSGVIFEFDNNTSSYQVIHHFTDITGGKPGYGHLVEVNQIISTVVENAVDKTIRIFPNPTRQSVTVDLGQNYEAVQIKISNLLGQQISTQEFNNTQQLSLDLLGENGIYLLDIKTNTGKTASLKVLKQ